MAEEIVQYIYSDLIDIEDGNMRREISRDKVFDLAENIKANGLINPITIRPKGERYGLVAGQCRLLACRVAGIIRIPSIVKILDDSKALDIMAAENLERNDVDPVDEGRFYQRMIDEQKSTPEDIAKRVKRSVGYVESRLVIGSMPEYMQQFIKSEELGLGVALALMGIEPDEKRRLWVGLAIEQSISVRLAEHWAYQHRLGTLPDVVVSPTDVPVGPDMVPRTPMFTCQLDGTEHPTTELRMVAYSVKYAPAIAELGSAIRAELAAAPASPDQ